MKNKNMTKNIIIAALTILLLGLIAVNIYGAVEEKSKSKVTKDGKEIEVKWLINEKDIPYDLSEADKYELEQSYVCFEPEIRIRKVSIEGLDVSYILGIKADMTADGLARDEIEYDITEENYNLLFAKKEGNTIYKEL